MAKWTRLGDLTGSLGTETIRRAKNNVKNNNDNQKTPKSILFFRKAKITKTKE